MYIGDRLSDEAQCRRLNTGKPFPGISRVPHRVAIGLDLLPSTGGHFLAKCAGRWENRVCYMPWYKTYWHRC